MKNNEYKYITEEFIEEEQINESLLLSLMVLGSTLQAVRSYIIPMVKKKVYYPLKTRKKISNFKDDYKQLEKEYNKLKKDKNASEEEKKNLLERMKKLKERVESYSNRVDEIKSQKIDYDTSYSDDSGSSSDSSSYNYDSSDNTPDEPSAPQGDMVGPVTDEIESEAIDYFDKQESRKCEGLEKSELWKCKDDVADRTISFIRSKLYKCNSTVDPSGCREYIKNLIQEWKERQDNYKNRARG